ncbi:MAG: hypothetical protein KDA75_19030, partial [Planctomycetaceae bacterium]|nr:hypothetical protein [Planctomycetaceae bacterium]
PTRIMRRTLTATLAAGAEASWHDPLQRIAAFPVKLTVRFMNEQGDSAQPAARFQIVQDAHCQLIAGASEFELIANQPQTLPLTLATRAASTDKSEYRVGVTVVPLGASPRVEYVPPRVHTELTGLKSPAVMTTTIATTVTGQSAPHWIDLVTCTARFAADVEFDVRGPINHGARITLVAPPDVTGFEFTPEVLQTGRQTVRFTIDVRLAPRPQQTTLTFQIAPPPPQGGVRFAKPLPWRLQVEGPSPVNLAAVIGGRFPTQLTTAIADNEATASLDFTPIVNGTAAVAQGLTAEVVASGAGIATFGSPDSPLFTDMAAQIQVRPPASRPFFRDVLVQGHLQLRTRPPTAAVQPVQYPLVIAVRAPFKRLAFLLSVSLSGLLTVILLTRLYVKLRSTDVSS